MSFNMQNTAAFKEHMQQKVAYIEEVLKDYLPEAIGYPKTVLEAMSYSVEAGGKRLRPLMMLETFLLFNGKGKIIEPFMAAQEMIHTYSLVHDDLPAMDNDMYRRGRLTTHAVYGEAMAILTGDALLNYAYETAASAFSKEDLSPAQYKSCAAALQILTTKAGIFGMVGGQVADVEAEKKNLSLDADKLMYIHENKTAALIQSALMIGGILAGAPKEAIQDLERAGYCIGIAFQIRDDILDIIGDEKKLGKPIGSDEKNEKLTYVKVYGMDKAKQDVEALSKEAIGIIQKYTGEDDFLLKLTESLVNREY